MSKPNCSSKIWDKFSAKQRRSWRMLYRDFSYEWGISEKKLTKQERGVIASNHATLGVWALCK